MKIAFDQTECSERGDLFFAGDCVLDSQFLSDPISDSLSDVIREARLAVVNLEAPVEGDDQIEKVGPIKSMPKEGIQLLSSGGFDMATLANNHAMDYGNSGLNNVQKACDEAGLDTIGTGVDQRSALEPSYKYIKGNSIALFNACHEEYGIATADRPGTAWIGDERLPKKIDDAAENVDFTVLVAHGGIEFVPIPPISWQKRLRKLADAGADVIIGHHPHVAQGWEIYKSVPIFYSLGNFLFHMPTRPSTRWGYGVEIHLADEDIDKCNILLTREGDSSGERVELARKDPIKQEYLRKVSSITSDSPANRGYWQEICAQIYGQRYQPSLEDYGNGHFTALSKTPIREIDRLTRGVFTRDKVVEQQERIFHHFIRNESHRDVIQTALGISSGAITDYRSPEIQSEVRELLTKSDDRLQESRFETICRNITEVAERINII